MGAADQIDDAFLAECVKSASQPGAVTSMVNYYRAMARGGGLRRQRALGFPKIEIPVLCIWGEQDIALNKQVTFGEAAYANKLVQRYLPDASHWVQHDQRELVNEMIAAWVGGEDVPHAPGAVGDIG